MSVRLNLRWTLAQSQHHRAARPAADSVVLRHDEGRGAQLKPLADEQTDFWRQVKNVLAAALVNPIVVSVQRDQSKTKPADAATTAKAAPGAPANAEGIALTFPKQLQQQYVTPPVKQRLVSLIGFLQRMCCRFALIALDTQ